MVARTDLLSHVAVLLFDLQFYRSLAVFFIHCFFNPAQILFFCCKFLCIVITDDLAMDAVKQYANGEAAVLAVLAGNDMLITSDYQNDIPAVLAAVADGRIAESDIDAHVLRILRYKQAQGWIE